MLASMSTVRLDDPRHERARRVLVERERPRVGADVVDEVGDDRVPVGPVGLGRRRGEPRPQPVGRGREPWAAGARRDQRQRRDPVGVVEREVLRDPAAHGDAHDVRPRDAESVE